MKKDDGAKKILRALNDIDDRYIEEAAAAGEKVQRVHPRKIVKFRKAVMIAAAAAACFAALLAVRILTWRSGSASPSSGSMETADAYEDAAAASNPYTEAGSLAEAEALAGFDITLPAAEAPYSNVSYTVIDGAMIDATYTDDAGEVGFYIRKARISGSSENAAADSLVGDNDAAGSIADGEEGTAGGEEAAADNTAAENTAAAETAAADDRASDSDAAADNASGGNTNVWDDISGDYNTYADKKEITVNGVRVTLRGNDGTWSVAAWTENGYAYAVGAAEHPLPEEKITALAAEIK